MYYSEPVVKKNVMLYIQEWLEQLNRSIMLLKCKKDIAVY